MAGIKICKMRLKGRNRAQEREKRMAFVNGFLSYLLLLIVFVVVGGTAIFLGITLRKGTDAKAEKAEAQELAEQVQK